MAAKTLCAGGVVAFPTDTLYGLVSTLENVKKLYTIKKRSALKPCALFVTDVAAIGRSSKIFFFFATICFPSFLVPSN